MPVQVSALGLEFVDQIPKNFKKDVLKFCFVPRSRPRELKVVRFQPGPNFASTSEMDAGGDDDMSDEEDEEGDELFAEEMAEEEAEDEAAAEEGLEEEEGEEEDEEARGIVRPSLPSLPAMGTPLTAPRKPLVSRPRCPSSRVLLPVLFSSLSFVLVRRLAVVVRRACPPPPSRLLHGTCSSGGRPLDPRPPESSARAGV